MKYLATLFFFFSIACFAADPAWVQSATSANLSSGNGPTFNSDVSAGHLLVVRFGWTGSGQTPTSVTFGGQTLTAASFTVHSTTLGNGANAFMYYTCNSPSVAAPAMVAITFTGSGNFWSFAEEYSGVATTNCLDKTAAAVNPGPSGTNTMSVASTTPATTPELAVVMVQGDGSNTWSLGAGYSHLVTCCGGSLRAAVEDAVVSAATTAPMSALSLSQWVDLLALFKPIPPAPTAHSNVIIFEQ